MLTIGNEQSRAVTLQFALCALIVALALGGCQQQQQEQEQEVVLAVSPDPGTVSVSSDFAAKAIEAAGGLSAWTKTREVRLASVVTLYQPDGSHYISEQSYHIYPWSNSIEVSAHEPQGELLWRLSSGQFDVLKGDRKLDELPRELASRDLTEAVLTIVTTPARFLDNSAEFAAKGTPVKIQGQWHQAIDRTPKSSILSGPSVSEALFYQNTGNSLIDMLQFDSAAMRRKLTVRGYDYDEIEKGGPLVPRRIEIFTTDKQGNAQHRLVKIDSHTLGKVK